MKIPICSNRSKDIPPPTQEALIFPYDTKLFWTLQTSSYICFWPQNITRKPEYSLKVAFLCHVTVPQQRAPKTAYQHKGNL